MLKRSHVLALLFAMVTLPGEAMAERRPPGFMGIRWDLGLRTEASGGVLSGYHTLRHQAPLAEAALALEPKARLGKRWRLSLPTHMRYRHMQSESLRQWGAGSGPVLTFRASRRWELEGDGGIEGVYRPGWPDQYQVEPDGSLGRTNRFSYFTPHVGASARYGSFKRLRLKLAYAFSVVDYADDPAYDPNEEPTHLVPGDRLEHAVRFDAHRRWGILSVKPGFDVTYKHYFNAYARDGGTGLTHAGAGGTPANPVLRLWDLEPGVRVEVRILGKRLFVTAGYVHDINIDIHQGYYSYHGPRPSLDIDAKPGKDWTLELDTEAAFRLYGSGSYAEGGSHPPLEEGSRRSERQFKAKLKAAYAVGAGFAVFARAEWLRKESNLPDYVPGVYPTSRQYSIDWDYTNVAASCGISYDL